MKNFFCALVSFIGLLGFSSCEKDPEVTNEGAYNVIYYTSTDGQIVEPEAYYLFGEANIVSNTYENGQGVITFDNQVKIIGVSAFDDVYNLKTIVLPPSVQRIETKAFEDCIALEEIRMEDGVSVIGQIAFVNCRSLTQITLPSGLKKIEYGLFNNCISLESITIPESVTSIGNSVFGGCSSLTSITIPDAVTSIGSQAFYACHSLTSIHGKYASEDRRCLVIDGVLNSFAPAGLTEYTIPDGVISIGDCAFAECSNLTSVTIPDGVTSIGRYAFTYCDNLTSVYCKPTTPPAAIFDNDYWSAFGGIADGTKIYVPNSSVEAYKTAEGWSDYAYYIVGYEF